MGNFSKKTMAGMDYLISLELISEWIASGQARGTLPVDHHVDKMKYRF